jgi:hypothetical protein
VIDRSRRLIFPRRRAQCFAALEPQRLASRFYRLSVVNPYGFIEYPDSRHRSDIKPGLESHDMRPSGSLNSFLGHPFSMWGDCVYKGLVGGYLSATNEERNVPGLGLVAAPYDRIRHPAKSQGARR